MTSPEEIETTPIEVIKPSLYQKLLSGYAIDKVIEENIILGSD